MAKMRRKIIHLYNTSLQCVLFLKCDKNLIDSRRYAVSKWGKHSRCIFRLVGLCYAWKKSMIFRSVTLSKTEPM